MAVSNNIDVPILWINCAPHVDRRKKMQEMFDRYGVDNTRIEGVYANNLQSLVNTLIPINDGLWSKYAIYSAGILGCTLSHLNASKYIVDNNLESAIVLEDDANISLFYEHDIKLSKIIEKVPDADVISLWMTPEVGKINYLKPENFTEGPMRYHLGSYWGSVGYWISKRLATKIVSSIYNQEEEKWDLTKIDCKFLVSDYVIFSYGGDNAYVLPCLQTGTLSTLRCECPEIIRYNKQTREVIDTIKDDYI